MTCRFPVRNDRYLHVMPLNQPIRIVQQSGHDDRPERGDEMSAAGERNLAAERRGRVEVSGKLAIKRFWIVYKNDW